MKEVRERDRDSVWERGMRARGREKGEMGIGDHPRASGDFSAVGGKGL